eukprot:COSAG01_NODE_411_length_17360_cov_11.401852_11_plen_217_part_00
MDVPGPELAADQQLSFVSQHDVSHPGILEPSRLHERAPAQQVHDHLLSVLLPSTTTGKSCCPTPDTRQPANKRSKKKTRGHTSAFLRLPTSSMASRSEALKSLCQRAADSAPDGGVGDTHARTPPGSPATAAPDKRGITCRCCATTDEWTRASAGGGDSFVRVHWVAVLKAMRARRASRRRRRRRGTAGEAGEATAGGGGGAQARASGGAPRVQLP